MTVSVIVSTFNTKELLKECLLSLQRSEKVLQKEGFSMEIIVTDNGSDDSPEMVKKEFPEVKLSVNGNVGFSKMNNLVRGLCTGKYVLMLNADARVEDNTILESITYMEQRPEVGAMTSKIILTDGTLDKDARRSFPTPWVAFTHMTKLDTLFPTSRLFAQYWYGYMDPNQEAEVDVLQGAYCFVRRDVLEKIDWYDEDYFLNGEDIDLCWRIKEAGYKIMYYPKIVTYHHKGASKGKKQKTTKVHVDLATKKKVIIAGTDAMAIFYRKRMWKNNPLLLNYFVLAGIYCMKQLRLLKFYLTHAL